MDQPLDDTVSVDQPLDYTVSEEAQPLDDTVSVDQPLDDTVSRLNHRMTVSMNHQLGDAVLDDPSQNDSLRGSSTT